MEYAIRQTTSNNAFYADPVRVDEPGGTTSVQLHHDRGTMITNMTAAVPSGGVGAGGFFFLFIAAGILFVYIFALSDLFKYSDASWVAARQNKVLMLLLVLLIPFVGALVYLVAAMPVLRRAQAALSPE